MLSPKRRKTSRRRRVSPKRGRQPKRQVSRRRQSRRQVTRRKNSRRQVSRRHTLKRKFSFPQQQYGLSTLVDKFSNDELQQMFGFTYNEIRELKGDIPVNSFELDSLINKMSNLGLISSQDDLNEMFSRLKVY